ncbi:hypothetical protein WV31_12935 [Magnetospirillum sp. ME-1]|nr:hypothetical protein WV31_12935 [Magnetospirillum sp. ME-1]
MLDIGCFDGTLLRAIDAKLTDVTLVGFDVAEGMRKQFPTDEKYSFVSGCLEQINRTFDLVVLSHSLQYIRDIHNLFRHFDRFLTENGRIFVQVPNFTMKPTSLLLGDLYYHYTPAILRNIFAQHGYRFETLSTPWFPRDILGMAVRDGSRLMKGLEDDCDVYKARDYLVSAADALRSAVFDDDNVGVLGTTFEATFVDSIIGEKIKFFVDENPNVVGHNFRRKPVFGPDYLTDADTLIIPYGETAHRIRDRFSRVYRGKFVLI